MASADEIIKYISVGADLLGGVVKGVGLAMQAFGSGNFEEGLTILDETLGEGRVVVGNLRLRLADVNAKADAAEDAKFPPAAPDARVFKPGSER